MVTSWVLLLGHTSWTSGFFCQKPKIPSSEFVKKRSSASKGGRLSWQESKMEEGGVHGDPSAVNSSINLHFSISSNDFLKKDHTQVEDVSWPTADIRLFLNKSYIFTAGLWRRWEEICGNTIVSPVPHEAAFFISGRCTWPPSHISSVSPWELLHLCQIQSKPVSSAGRSQTSHLRTKRLSVWILEGTIMFQLKCKVTLFTSLPSGANEKREGMYLV